MTAVRQKAYDIGMKTDVYQYFFYRGDIKLLACTCPSQVGTGEKLYPKAITQELAERPIRKYHKERCLMYFLINYFILDWLIKLIHAN